MKKFTAFFIFLIMLLSSFSINVKAAAAPNVSADSAVLIDAATGEVLYSKNMNSSYPPASTTKIMTALLTLEKCNLDDVVTVGKKPPLADGSRIYIFENEKITVRELLYALLLSSANDCAEALAEHISGSTEEFAKLMNKRAMELGCKNTNFVNPSGLYDEKHKTSAYDLALIMQELSKHDDYSKIATTLSHKIPVTNKSNVERPLWNENKLIQKYSEYFYSSCLGGKTGYTVQSMHSYVSVAEKDGHKLVLALVHDTQKTFFYDAIALFNYGYANYEYVKLYSENDFVENYTNKNTTIPLLASKDFYYLREKGTTPKVDLKLSDNQLNLKYFSNGDTVTSTEVYLNGEKTGTLELKSGVDHKLLKIIIGNFIIFAPIIAVILGLAFFIYKKIKNKKRN